ncbi:MAG: glycosyltransferase family 2 protein [Bdellovibrionales bacterium]|nr:glycosyltransferase family 2 protein [Bdellovibrionales bacterium]
MKSLGIAIPTFNSQESLRDLLQSIVQSHLIDLCEKVVVTDDGSTDQTETIFTEFIKSTQQPEKWKFLDQKNHLGRFRNRLAAAEYLKSEWVLFLDSRIELPQDFSIKLSKSSETHSFLMGTVKINPQSSIFDLYWERTQQWAFRGHYKKLNEGIWVDGKNYEQYMKGTGALLCPRHIFIRECVSFKKNLLSDDTYLLKKFAQKYKIYIPSNLFVKWHPRRTLIGFLARLYERGPGFVEYHVLHHRGLYFYFFMFALICFAATVAGLFLSPLLGLKCLFFLVATLAATTFLFSESLLEAVRLIPLHILSIAAYFIGSLVGLIKLTLFKRKTGTK